VSSHPLIVVRLVLRFLLHSLLSGLTTARIILAPRQPPSGVVVMHYGPMNSTGAALLGAMVTLTPGSTVIDIDQQCHEMLLHLLDVRTKEAAIASIRNDFEQELCLLFPEE
jgi:multisubunit Na+/H+ antiporter MnhE subunit